LLGYVVHGDLLDRGGSICSGRARLPWMAQWCTAIRRILLRALDLSRKFCCSATTSWGLPEVDLTWLVLSVKKTRYLGTGFKPILADRRRRTSWYPNRSLRFRRRPL